jgi:hypothetical protein
MDIDDAKRDTPKTESDDEKRAQLRSATVEPKLL